MSFASPVAELRFLLDTVAGYDQVAATDRFAEASADTVTALLTEAGKLCDEVLAPLQRPGDMHPARLENGIVRTSPGFAEGYRAIAEGGYIAMGADPEYGGLGLPMALTTCVNEMMAGACLSLQLNPLMSQGQIEALEQHASDAIKELYLPRLISGEWSGTMNLTEPQAGSDVGALRTKAEPNGDGTYAVSGQKIYISWADNDFTENVCHLVLARLPDAVPGTKGISLFMVPKVIPNEDGSLGQRNSLRVVSLEHKLGLHASPTAVMEYDGATGWLVGAENGGMAAMFTMMNNARLGVATQGIGVAEAATQAALAYAAGRTQGRTHGPTGTIIDHADVRRMLATMRAETMAARSIALLCAVAIDMETATGERSWASRAALLTPIAKSFGTDVGVEVASMGIQVHGGMGFIEETGAAQFLRDARVATIYEGTNGIQALDLVGRKLADGGEAATRLIDEICEAAEAARAKGLALADAVYEAAESLRDATEWLVSRPVADRQAGAVAYQRAFARVLGGYTHLIGAQSGEKARERLAAFYIRTLLPEHDALLEAVRAGDTVDAITPDDLVA